MTTTTILGLCGSLRARSLNLALLQAAVKLADPSHPVSLYPTLANLPLFNPDLEPSPPPSVLHFRAAIAAADALIIASPEYAHGVTGTIKNALDWLVSFAPFVHKPIAVWNTSPRAHHADAALRETLTTMSACIIAPAALSLPILGRHDNADAIFHAFAQPIQQALGHLIHPPR